MKAPPEGLSLFPHPAGVAGQASKASFGGDYPEGCPGSKEVGH